MREPIPADIFWGILEKNGGLFHQTAGALSAILGREVHRDEVRIMANASPLRLKDIRLAMVDLAESVILKTMMDTDNPKLAFDASKYYLDSLGKKRGFGKTPTLSITDGDTVVFADAIKRIREKVRSNPLLEGAITTHVAAPPVPPLPR